MSPLEFPVFDVVGRASATYQITLGEGTVGLEVLCTPSEVTRTEVVTCTAHTPDGSSFTPTHQRSKSGVLFSTTLGCLLIAVGRVHGQATQKECEKAAKVRAKGHPDKKEEAAFQILTRCGTVGARAFASGLATYSTSTDLSEIEPFAYAMHAWTDSSIVNAAIDLATNGSATIQARVLAVRHLIYTLQPLFLFSHPGLTVGPDTTILADGTVTWTPEGCRGSMISERHGALQGDPLPPNAPARIRAVLAGLASSAATPILVRRAATYVLPP